VNPEGPPPKTDLIGRVSARVLELPPARWLKPILDDYQVAGGGLLASGLAFNSLFAVLPAILLIVSLLGLSLNDPTRLEQVIQAFARQFPPLQEFFRQAFDQFRAGAVSFSVLGLVGLVWGSSRFYQSLDEAIARIFRGSRERDPFQRGLRGVLSVGLLIGAVIGAVGLSRLLSDVLVGLPGTSRVVDIMTSTLGSLTATVAIFTGVVALIYRIVPTDTPSWRAIRRPAVATGMALAVLTGIFALLTPRLIGALHVYAAFVAVFAAMIWLSYLAQVLLIGAAWVHRRAQGEAQRLPV
jgi:YihY family inner membrane protein